MKRILVILGTRPEAVKMAPVVHALRSMTTTFEVHLCSTGQHQRMLQQILDDFDLVPDSTLNVMTANQTLAALSARLFDALDALLLQTTPDIILVQGDTTTVQVAALCAFYRHIPVGHVEAGLRTYNLAAPFPEEMNRRVAGMVARWHYAPTEAARQNLLREQVDPQRIFVTGNTVVDALLMALAKTHHTPPPLPPHTEAALCERRQIVLVTGHRRENFGEGFRHICSALAAIGRALPEARIIYPVHLNPNVREPVFSLLHDVSNIYLEDPLPYLSFVRLMEGCTLILTDSGGIQEEAPTLGKPVLIMRSETERPEGVEAGVNRLVGTNCAEITQETLRLLRDPAAIASMAACKNPYGDGLAAQRIAQHLASV